MLPNRLKFAVGAPLLELYNPHIAGRPHQRVAERVHDTDRRVLEVCSGSGYLSRLVAARLPDCVIDALDISEESLQLGTRLARKAGLRNLSFTHASAAEMPFPADTFDTAISCYGLHEIPSADRTRTYAELARVVRPGGRVIVADWDTPEKGARTVEFVINLMEKPHAIEVVRNGIVDALREVGFTVLRHDRALGRLLSFQLVEAQL